MPAKNSLKQYTENGYYHIYNRGVEKRIIFQDAQDYAVFLSYLKNYLLPKDEERLRAQLSDPDISYKLPRTKSPRFSLNKFTNLQENLT